MGDVIPDFPDAPDVRYNEKVECDELPVVGKHDNQIPVCFGVLLRWCGVRYLEGKTGSS